ncbi:Carrier domain-containing protein OS=Streptomyces microflavus OX=1919 GN=Smic_75360 PE=4 SV=1 [Streptomyces microflavus]
MVLDRLDVLRGAVTVEPPRNATEERIRDICRAVFRVGTIGVTENLFDLGADSIATIQLLARLRDDGVAVVSHEEFYKEPTVRHLAEQAAAGSAPDVPAAVVPRAADPTAEVPLTPQQRRLWFSSRPIRRAPTTTTPSPSRCRAAWSGPCSRRR